MRVDPDFPVWIVVSRRSVAMTIVKVSRRKIAGPNSVVKHIGSAQRSARSGDAAAGQRATETASIAVTCRRCHDDPRKPLVLTVHNCAAPLLVKKMPFSEEPRPTICPFLPNTNGGYSSSEGRISRISVE
jgi:hypothetical protein